MSLCGQVAADFLMSRLGLGSLVSSEMEQEEKATRATSQDKARQKNTKVHIGLGALEIHERVSYCVLEWRT